MPLPWPHSAFQRKLYFMRTKSKICQLLGNLQIYWFCTEGSHRIFKTCHELFLCLYVCTDSGKSNVTCVTDLNGTYVILPFHPCEANEYKSKLFQSKKGLRNVMGRKGEGKEWNLQEILKDKKGLIQCFLSRNTWLTVRTLTCEWERVAQYFYVSFNLEPQVSVELFT